MKVSIFKKKSYPYIDEYGREVRLIKKSVTHPDVCGDKIIIGGKEFVIDEHDKRITDSLTNWEVLKRENYATSNFIERRPDFNIDFPHKLYYGHIFYGDTNLGFIVAEDEFENGDDIK